jgi:hypothetical protein
MVLAEVLEKTTLQDLLCGEKEMTKRIEDMTSTMLPFCSAPESAVGTTPGQH